VLYKDPPDFDVKFPVNLTAFLSCDSLGFLFLIVTFSDTGDDSGSCLLFS
jgi:hypothetical protein